MAEVKENLKLQDLNKGDLFVFLHSEKTVGLRLLVKGENQSLCNYAFIFSDEEREFRNLSPVRRLTQAELDAKKVLPPQSLMESLFEQATILQKRLEQYINATPSGELRNNLTQQNIDSLLAMDKVNKNEIGLGEFYEVTKNLHRRLEDYVNSIPLSVNFKSNRRRSKLFQEYVEALPAIRAALAALNDFPPVNTTLDLMKKDLAEVKAKLLKVLDEVTDEKALPHAKQNARQDLHDLYGREKVLEKYIKILEAK